MIPGELIQIEGDSVPSCKSYEVKYDKVWKDRSENMAGDFRGTLLGIKANISVEFGGELLQSDVTNLLPKLAEDYFDVTYYDPQTDTQKTAKYYVDGYTISILSKHKGQFYPISVDFLPVSRSV